MNKYKLTLDKLQKDALNGILKGETWYILPDESNGLTYISNGYFVFSLENKNCFLKGHDEERTSIKSFANILERNTNNISTVDTGLTKKIGKDVVRIFRDSDSNEILLNEKYCKYFDKLNNIQLRSSGKNTPVQIEYQGTIIGTILPIIEHQRKE